MTPRQRVAVAIAISAIALATMGAYSIFRLVHWHRHGIAGLTYVPAVPGSAKQRAKKMSVAFATPGAVVFVYPGGVAERAGIRAADVIRSIDGIPVDDLRGLAQLNDRARTGDRIRYVIEREGHEHAVEVTLVSPLHNGYFLLNIIVAVLVADLFFAIGILVLARGPDDRRSAVLFAMVSFGAMSLLGSIPASLDGSNVRGIIVASTAVLSVAASVGIFSLGFLPLTLHLSLVFPKDRPVLRKRPAMLRWVYALPVFVGLVMAVAVATMAIAQSNPALLEQIKRSTVIAVAATAAAAGLGTGARVALLARKEGARNAFLDRPVQSLIAVTGLITAVALLLGAVGFSKAALLLVIAGAVVGLGVVMLYPIFSCIALYRSYRESGVEERQQVKWPLWGTIIALVIRIVIGTGGFLGGMFAAFNGRPPGNMMTVLQITELTARLAYILIPLSFAFAIFKYRLMNIDLIIKRTVAYAILSGVIIVIYVGMVGGVGSLLVGVAGLRNQTMVIASTVVVALIFVPLRNKLQLLVDRNLFRQKYDYPQALQTLSEETVEARDAHAFLRRCAEVLQQALQSRSVVIFMNRNGDLLAIAKVGLSDQILGALRIRTSAVEGLPERAFDPRRRTLPTEVQGPLQQIDATLCLPFGGAGDSAALLALGGKLAGREYDVEDLDFLASAADQIRVGLDRIRLGTEESEFAQAREMQRALLPSTLPRIEGLQVSGTWQPARAVGGDYYDVLDLGDGRIAFCIGDVAGKGMGAALLMSSLQSAVRASAHDARGAADLCERVRRVVVSNLAGGRFITFFYALYDSTNGTLVYSNAGHNPPLLVRANGTTARLESGGPALARLLRQKFEQGTEPFAPGDRLLLFTDGVTEAASAQSGDLFGDARLEELVRTSNTLDAAALEREIVNEVTAFAGGDLEDDLTLIVVSRQA